MDITTLHAIKARVLSGGSITYEEALQLPNAPRQALFDAAHEITTKMSHQEFNLCGIVNAKSGLCAEDCKWCSQSKFYQTDSPEYSLIDEKTAVQSAMRAEDAGIARFSLVTSGRKLSRKDVRKTCDLVRAMRQEVKMEMCASLGLLEADELQQLADAGVVRYHCNLEAAPSYFPEVCTTHTPAEKMKTLRAAKAAGMEICSGGIIGMGESYADRVELAFALKELEVPSIPINILAPIAGTPLGDMPLLPEEDVLLCIAVFRFIHPNAYLRLAGGRERLSEACLKQSFQVGINSAIAGDLLTTSGSNIEKDKRLVLEAGYTLPPEATQKRVPRVIQITPTGPAAKASCCSLRH